MYAVELPGRGNRFGEPLVDSLRDAAQAVAVAIANDELLQDALPPVLFGHSLGAFLAYEVAWFLEQSGTDVARLVASGALPPDEARVEELRHKMSDQELLDELRAFGATPIEVLEHRELMELYLPIIRADFKMLETYEQTEPKPLKAPITAVAGREDQHVGSGSLDGWQRYTQADLHAHWFPGDHFYLAQDTEEFVRWFMGHLKTVGLSGSTS